MERCRQGAIPPRRSRLVHVHRPRCRGGVEPKIERPARDTVAVAVELRSRRVEDRRRRVRRGDWDEVHLQLVVTL